MKLFFSFNGRINRGKYLMANLVLGITMVVLMEFLFHISHRVAWKITILIMIVTTYSNFCLSMKRLHDLEKGGYYWLIFLVPFANFYLQFRCFFIKGTDGKNQYGDDPLDWECN